MLALVSKNFWEILLPFNIVYNVVEFIKRSENCQKQGKIPKKIFPDLQNVPVPNEVMALTCATYLRLMGIYMLLFALTISLSGPRQKQSKIWLPKQLQNFCMK